ncbi:head-tail joining protein [Xanthomonas arboricola]|uniref:head-tail joining protein n=1 Tax=Xanthomonas arboricola TaxID=56448 RepID=UPI004040C830
MSQRDFLRRFDATAFAVLNGAGLADRAVYTAPGGAQLPCTVTIDRDVANFGDDEAPVSAPQTLVTFQRSEVEPVRFARLTLDGDVFVLDQRIRQDESISQWVVANG